jgi:hypothetical protein
MLGMNVQVFRTSRHLFWNMRQLMVHRMPVIAIALSQIPSVTSGQFNSQISTVDRILAVHQSSNDIVSFGAFTNMRYYGEHTDGYTLELWRDQNRVFGLFLSSQGLSGDTPTGLLEDVRFNSQTGSLMFRARLTTGLFSNRQFSNVPSRYIYRFSGFLKGARLVGTLEITNALTPEEAPRRERIRLRRSKREAETMIEAQSYDDWKHQADEILKRRGPKW